MTVIQHQMSCPSVDLTNRRQTIVRLAVAIEAPTRRVRWLLKLAQTLATACDVSDRTAMLQIADSFGRAASDGCYTEIRDVMLTAEQRARRLAEHLS